MPTPAATPSSTVEPVPTLSAQAPTAEVPEAADTPTPAVTATAAWPIGSDIPPVLEDRAACLVCRETGLLEVLKDLREPRGTHERSVSGLPSPRMMALRFLRKGVEQVNPLAFGLAYLVSWLLIGLGAFVAFRLVVVLAEPARHSLGADEIERQTGRRANSRPPTRGPWAPPMPR